MCCWFGLSLCFQKRQCQWDKDKHKKKRREKEDCESAEESEQQSIKYVEAPLPVVDPRTKSKVNAPQPIPEIPLTSVPTAPVVTAQVGTIRISAPVEKLSDKDKRILQPQVPLGKVENFMRSRREKIEHEYRLKRQKKENRRRKEREKNKSAGGHKVTSIVQEKE